MAAPLLPPSLVQERDEKREEYKLINAIRKLLTTQDGLTSILDMISSTRGTVLFRGASGWEALPPGTAGWRLTTNGAGADPSWAP
jgi:hypothetical protein